MLLDSNGLTDMEPGILYWNVTHGCDKHAKNSHVSTPTQKMQQHRKRDENWKIAVTILYPVAIDDMNLAAKVHRWKDSGVLPTTWAPR